MSQRHKVENYGYASNDEVRAQGTYVPALVGEANVTGDAVRGPEEDRTFPLGPFDLVLVSVTQDPLGVWYHAPADADIRTGDIVEVEATGNSATNGVFQVEDTQTSDKGTMFFRPDVELDGEIEARGRVSVPDPNHP